MGWSSMCKWSLQFEFICNPMRPCNKRWNTCCLCRALWATANGFTHAAHRHSFHAFQPWVEHICCVNDTKAHTLLGTYLTPPFNSTQMDAYTLKKELYSCFRLNSPPCLRRLGFSHNDYAQIKWFFLDVFIEDWSSARMGVGGICPKLPSLQWTYSCLEH